MQTIVDCRLGGEPRYFVGNRRDSNMRLPDEVQKCVVFVGRRGGTGGTRKFVPTGTAFLVSVPSPQTSGFDMTYLVTAKHVAEKLEPDFDIRFNTKDGRAEYVEVTGRQWYYHPNDKSVDAAVMLWGPPPNMDCLWIPSRIFMDDGRMAQKGIGVGDEVYATGLFAPVIGAKRNTPIVRTGHLAMSPPESVPLKDWVAPTMEAYLIEMRSLGGLSGSPVFVQRSIEVQPTEETGRKPLAAGAIFLLGLMHGHWNVRHLEVDYVSPPTNEKDLLNSGIAIIVPAAKITEILQQEALQTLYRAAEDFAMREHPNYLDAGSPTAIAISSTEPMRVAVSAAVKAISLSATDEFQLAPDTVVLSPSAKDSNPQHKADFMRLLDAAAKTKKQGD